VEHAEVQEGEVVLGLAIASSGDPASSFQPGIGALDRPAMARQRVTRLQLSLLAAPDLARRLPGGDRLVWGRRLLMQGSIWRSRSALASALES
jgi:hypothetical protein